MANQKNIDDRLKKIREQKNLLIEKEKKLIAQQKTQDRKARTKRLIEIGAIVESVLGRPIQQDELSNLKKFLQQQESRGEFFSKAMNVDNSKTTNDINDDEMPF